MKRKIHQPNNIHDTALYIELEWNSGGPFEILKRKRILNIKMTCGLYEHVLYMKNSNTLKPMNKLSDERKCSQNCPSLSSFYDGGVWCLFIVPKILRYENVELDPFLSVIFVWLMTFLSIYSVSYGLQYFLVFCSNTFRHSCAPSSIRLFSVLFILTISWSQI